MRRLAIAAALVAGAAYAGAQPLGTSFTYQGRLTDAGNPANGSYDLQLALFDAASGGAQVGATLSRNDVVVANGLFTVSLDFGAVFSGSKRWLELRVRPGASTGAYTTLGPRQELTPSPNAAFSLATPWTGISGKPAGFADDIDNDSGGDITGVTAGTGLTGGGTTGAVTLGANLAGSGSASTIARSDHDHFAQSWSGSTANGLTVSNAGGEAIRGVTTAVGSNGVFGSSQSSSGIGLYGQALGSGSTRGVVGEAASSSGVGVYGANSAAGGVGVTGGSSSTAGAGAAGVYGWANGLDSSGVRGVAASDVGVVTGVVGQATSPEGRGVWGNAYGPGTGVGVWGTGRSPNGLGGYFQNLSGSAPALGVDEGGIRFGDGSIQTAAGWALNGNAGTSPSSSFLGTTDNVPLELRVNNQRALRLESVTTATHVGQNVLAGYPGNSITAGVTLGTVAGGGGISVGSEDPNRVTDTGGTVAGGSANQAGNGGSNVEDAWFATVSGGNTNTASGLASAVVGGANNTASGRISAVSGGFGNTASGENAAVPGGFRNVAGGSDSLAAGRFAWVRDPAQSGDPDGDEGTFVWADSHDLIFQSTGPHQFLIRAAGGVGVNTNSPSPGGLTVAPPGKLTFGPQTRQVIDLNNASYGIGTQGGVVYFRTEPPGGMFTWFLGGSHSDVQNDPGPGGFRQMRLDGGGNLFVRGSVFPGGADFAEMLPAEAGLEPGDVLA
ncbi:MAG TPA: hypothetical protein VFQ51_08485, partial [Vicinamibacteria bacterium]|nr:hypothetical protein [Vicinamibacteria bacterium]